MILDTPRLIAFLIDKLCYEYGAGCRKHYLALSGGVDSSTVAVLLCRAFGAKNVVAMYRNLKSQPLHYQHVNELRRHFPFHLIYIDGNAYENALLVEIQKQFKRNKLAWFAEGSRDDKNYAFASSRSRFNTWVGAIISKMADDNGGRIYGTGNGEEDRLYFFFDKFGDGAVDNNILAGMNKAEVRKLALALGVPRAIIVKKPSDDLFAGQTTNFDETQLSAKARRLGYRGLRITYGSPDGRQEGNGAWAWREDLRHGWLARPAKPAKAELKSAGYLPAEIQLIWFLWDLRRQNAHKILNIPGTDRRELMRLKLVE
jgi:NAD+ synthetase